ncbi:MAG: DUF2309 domain-containing protein [Planctomycetes bacterium]|nr:DUF2309 domain-containing protein [Planctomycetota bacterium]
MSHGVGSDRPVTTLEEIVDEVAHLLPEQAPLHTFVHHNTLHAFEHLPFDRAVVEAAQLFGTRAFQTEAAFAEHQRCSRILPGDIAAVASQEVERRSGGNAPIVDRFTPRDYIDLRLRHLFEIPRGAALAWQLQETDLLHAFHPGVDVFRRRELSFRADRMFGGHPTGQRVHCMLSALWKALAEAAGANALEPRATVRRRDQLVACGADDVDQRVHPVLIRLCAAFLDQGVSSWGMPFREQGFLTAVRRLYGLPVPAPDAWQRDLAHELRTQEREGRSAVETCRSALALLGVGPEQWHTYIRATLLCLRGWAGMMRQFELRPDRAPVEPRPARLLDYLAVQLTFDAVAARAALRERFGADATWDRLAPASFGDPARPDLEPVYEAFVMAQIAHVDIEAFLRPEVAARWLEEARAVDATTRCRLLHAAYERRLRIAVLDGLAAHCRDPLPAPPEPRLQAIFCIDERECSTRRHFEETMPAVETFGFAGFFGVAMAWQGLGELRPRPLCPVNVTPGHYVTERALNPSEEQVWRNARRRLGLTTQALMQGSRTLTRGGLVSTFLGLWSVVPMVGRCLAPRLAEWLLHGVAEGSIAEPITRLVLEREGDAKDAEGRFIGYAVSEMAEVVENLLRTIGLTDGFCELVLVVGHGSSSLNNPHESAHDCGATGGGRGGPNARAFAAMANHPAVRDMLAQRGIVVPPETWFVGCYHNTCDDDMTWYDEDVMPEARQRAFAEAREALEAACLLESHERCRRFESAPHGSDAPAALRHVKGRAVDLAQPRPEYGHATNAYAIVGRRTRTRNLFLDRRAFLVSYDPTTDADGSVLTRLLGAVVPVGAGINLEYYFSFVDPVGYGCGTKLPHNITGLIGVMDGHASDLRTGLPWQMVEIHEPVRLLAIVETEPERLARILDQQPGMKAFVDNGWIQLVAWSPTDDRLWEYSAGAFHDYQPESRLLPVVASSATFYRTERGHLGLARVLPGYSDGGNA